MFGEVFVVRLSLRRIHIGVKSDREPEKQQSGKIKELHQDGHLKNNRLVSGKPYSWLSSIRQDRHNVIKEWVVIS